MRLRSRAPKARAYQSAATAASGTTRWTLSFIARNLRRVRARVLYV